MNRETIGDLCEHISELVEPQNHAGSLYLGLEHLVAGRCARVGGGVAADVQSSKFCFKKGDVLYSKLRPYLDKAILADTDGICTTELLVLRPKDGTDARFVVGVLHATTFIEHAMSGITGAQHPRTSWHRISEFRVPNLDPLVRWRIGDAVWALERARSLCEDASGAAEQLKQVAVRELFACGLSGAPRKETEIGPVPEGWVVERLDRRARVVSTAMSYEELKTLAPSNYANGETVVGIRVSDMNLTGNEIVIGRTALEKHVEPHVLKRCAAPATIVFPKRGAAIATNKKRLTTTWSVFDPNVIGVVAGDTLDQRFFFHWFQGFDLRAITEPGPTPQLNKKNLDPLPIPVPPSMEEQREIASVLDAIDAKIDLQRRKRALLEELFKTLLSKVMAGEIRAPDLDLSVSNQSEGRIEATG